MKLSSEKRQMIMGWMIWRDQMRAFHQEGLRIAEEDFWRSASLSIVAGEVRQSDVAELTGYSREYVRQRTLPYRIESAATIRGER